MTLPRIIATALISLSLVTAAQAECGRIISPSKARDGEILWRDNGRWRPVSDLNADLRKGARRTVTFAYVMKEPKEQDPRRGTIVIKSGFTKQESSPTHDLNTVRLFRPWIKDPCNRRAYQELQNKVSQRAYDDYHERNIKTDEDEVFAQFHIYYDSRSGCRYTNDASPDGLFSWGKFSSRSNKSQFSFDPEVVKKGQYGHIATWFGLRSAFADELIAGRKVQIRKYETDKQGIACVKFNIDVRPGAFIRVNDLEKRTLFGDNEATWNRDE